MALEIKRLGALDLFAPIPTTTSTTTDSFCTIAWTMRSPIVVLSHSVRAAFRFLGGEHEGKVVLLVHTVQRWLGGAEPDDQGYVVEGHHLEYFGLRNKVEERLLGTPEGGEFRYGNVRRYRLTGDEIMALLGGGSFATR
jgi:hypothetical protein